MKTLQNLATVSLTDAEYGEVDAALAVIERHFSSFVSLTPAQKQGSVKAGDKSDGFCSQVFTLVGQHADILPVNLKIEDALADLAAREKLRPRLYRLTALQQRAFDTEFALGSDAMAAALHGYRLLKANGRGFGLEQMQRELSNRFGRKRRPVISTSPVAPITGS